MASIYDITDYAAGTTYRQWTVIRYNGFFYYSLINNNVGNTPAVVSNFWGGRITDFNGEIKPYFIWKVNYGLQPDKTPNVKFIQYGDGYSQRIADGINNNLLKIDLLFEGRNLDEFTSLCHFLEQRNGVESFVWSAPPPFNKNKRFICRSWKPVLNFYDNNALSARFEEVSV